MRVNYIFWKVQTVSCSHIHPNDLGGSNPPTPVLRGGYTLLSPPTKILPYFDARLSLYIVTLICIIIHFIPVKSLPNVVR